MARGKGRGARKVSARAAEGKALRSQKAKAGRYARRLEALGYAEAARRIRESAGLIRAGRGRGYSEEAKAAARDVAAAVSRAREALASLPRFQREARSARRGMSSPLTQGLGFTDLRQFPRMFQTQTVRRVGKRGRVNEAKRTVELRSLAERQRFALMESYFYRSYRSGGLSAGPGQVLGWMGAEGLYPGSSNRLGSIVMGTDAESAFTAWRDFWQDPANRGAVEVIDRIAVELATNGRLSDETRDMAEDEGVLESSPRSSLTQSYGNARG